MHAATRKTLLKVKGFSEVKVEKIKEAIAKCQVSDQPSCDSNLRLPMTSVIFYVADHTSVAYNFWFRYCR